MICPPPLSETLKGLSGERQQAICCRHFCRAKSLRIHSEEQKAKVSNSGGEKRKFWALQLFSSTPFSTTVVAVYFSMFSVKNYKLRRVLINISAAGWCREPRSQPAQFQSGRNWFQTGIPRCLKKNTIYQPDRQPLSVFLPLKRKKEDLFARLLTRHGLTTAEGEFGKARIGCSREGIVDIAHINKEDNFQSHQQLFWGSGDEFRRKQFSGVFAVREQAKLLDDESNQY